MKRILAPVILCLAVAVTILAARKPDDQDTKPPAATPSVDQILEKYSQALGGKAAIEKISSTVVKGKFEVPAMGLTGTLETYAKAPNKAASIINIEGFGMVKGGFNGTVGWSQDPQTGLRELSGGELADTKRDGEFYKFIKLKELYPKITLVGKDKVGDREVNVLEATPTDGKPRKMYFDAQTGLLLRMDADRDTPQGPVHVETYFEDYRETGGMKLPFTTKLVRPDLSFSLKTEEVKQNVPIDDAKFNKPASQ